jgi:uncharacterized protein
MTNHSRRKFLKLGAAASVGLTATLSSTRQLRAELSAKVPGHLEPFPLPSVRLTSGIFKQQAEINERYLESLSVDRLLHSFRLTAGIPSTVAPYKGWEDPTCELRGHFCGGHYLSAVALASATADNSTLKERGNELVKGLSECQSKNGNHYLSAYPEDLFEHLAQDKPVWAPFYTYHKIMAGLLDMFVHVGNTDALKVAEGMAQWAASFMGSFGVDQRQRMLRNEYGGMNEVLVNLAVFTQKDRYLGIARMFEQPTFLDPLASRRDELQGLHANTHIPKIIGAARTYEVTGERRYREIAEYFLAEVLAARSYAIGNSSNGELWRTPAGQLQGTLEWSNAECCVAYNLMKLERQVFSWTGDARWMDAYERSMFNCRLGTQNAQGLKQYFFPLAAGYWRAYGSAEESFWCCTGTGVEEFAKFTDTVYFHRGSDIFVNQFISSALDWKDEGFGLEQVTNFPHEQGTLLKIKTSRPEMRTIHVRIPGWVNGDAQVRINGRLLEATADPGSYLAIRKSWESGDTIAVTLPMELHQEQLPGDVSISAPMYGPLVLAADLGAGPADGPMKIIHGRPTEPKDPPAPSPLPKAAATAEMPAKQWIQVESASELHFSAAAEGTQHRLIPMYEVGDQKYSVYWQLKNGNKQS